VFAVTDVQLASPSSSAAASDAAVVTRLRRSSSTASRHAFTPQVRSAVDARDVEQRNAFQ